MPLVEFYKDTQTVVIFVETTNKIEALKTAIKALQIELIRISK